MCRIAAKTASILVAVVAEYPPSNTKQRIHAV